VVAAGFGLVVGEDSAGVGCDTFAEVVLTDVEEELDCETPNNVASAASSAL
jgi:hypothetical protein